MAIPYKICLFIMNLFLLWFLLFQLVSSFRSKNKLLSWSTAFYTLCFIWTVLRLVFWVFCIVSTSPWDALTFYLLYWFPSPIQFANFSLLVLFYVQVLSGREWRRRYRYVALPLYFFVTFAMMAFTVGWAFVSYNQLAAASMVDQYYVQLANQSVQRLYSATSFGTLGFLFAYFGYLMARLETWQHRRMLITNPTTLAFMNAVLSALFVSRSVFDLGSGLQWWAVSELSLTGKRDDTLYDFLVNVFWEALPTVILLLMITTKTGGVGAPRRTLLISHGAKLPDYGLFQVINKKKNKKNGDGMKAGSIGSGASYGTMKSAPIQVAEQQRWTSGGDLFEDPLRYDSDENGPTPPSYQRMAPGSFLSSAGSSSNSNSHGQGHFHMMRSNGHLQNSVSVGLYGFQPGSSGSGGRGFQRRSPPLYHSLMHYNNLGGGSSSENRHGTPSNEVPQQGVGRENRARNVEVDTSESMHPYSAGRSSGQTNEAKREEQKSPGRKPDDRPNSARGRRELGGRPRNSERVDVDNNLSRMYGTVTDEDRQGKASQVDSGGASRDLPGTRDSHKQPPAHLPYGQQSHLRYDKHVDYTPA